MKLAQLEIKATVTVNTSDLGNRKREDDSQDKDVPVRKKGQRSLTIIWSLKRCEGELQLLTFMVGICV